MEDPILFLCTPFPHTLLPPSSSSLLSARGDYRSGRAGFTSNRFRPVKIYRENSRHSTDRERSDEIRHPTAGIRLGHTAKKVEQRGAERSVQRKKVRCETKCVEALASPRGETKCATRAVCTRSVHILPQLLDHVQCTAATRRR